MDFKEVMERVSIVVEKNLGIKPTDKVIARYLNISAPNFANMKKRNRIPFEEIAYFSAKYKVSTNWILFNQHCENLVQHEEKFYTLKVIDKINASCGGGAFEYEAISTKQINLDKEILNKLGYKSSNNLEAIKVIGDSMQPTLKEDDLILIDRASNKYNNHSIFLVNTTSGLFVKRLEIYDENKIDLISDNEEYSNSTFCVDEVIILGKVLGVLERHSAIIK